MVFQRRLEFKVIYGAILAGQLVFLAVGSGIDWGQWETVHNYATLLLSAGLGLILLNELLGYIRIDNDGILIKNLIGGKRVNWSDIENIDFWSEMESSQSFFQDKIPPVRIGLRNGTSLSINPIYQVAFRERLQQEAQSRALLRD